MRTGSRILGGLALVAAGAVVVQLAVGARSGPLPLVSVFDVHLLAVALVAAVLALPGTLGGGRARAWLRLGLVGVVVLGVVRLGDELWSPGPGEDGQTGPRLVVLSWNLEVGSKPGLDVVDGIAGIDADVVALQELTPALAAAIEDDLVLKARYPYRILEAREGSEGLGVLANRPLLVRGLVADGRALHAGLLLGDGRTAELLVVHPLRPPFRTTFSVPRSLDTRHRDEDLAAIRAVVDGLEDPAAAIVVGDLNTSPTEPGRAVLDDGLTDAHRAVGMGPGFTWRPDPLEAINAGLLRIDAVLAGGWLEPVTSDVDCSLPGDHCRLVVTLRVDPPATAD